MHSPKIIFKLNVDSSIATYKIFDKKYTLQFVYNLMACGKKSNNAPTEEFILESPAPVDVAAKLSAIYRELSLKVIFLGSSA